MPADYARFLIGQQRSAAANRQLGLVLAFVAGAINAGGFLAVAQYTSHMTGILSSLADHAVLGEWGLVLAGVGAVMAFVAGGMGCAILVNVARRQRLSSEYALPLLLEAGLIVCFGLLGTRLARIEGGLLPLTVLLLCFIMGLQNAVVTKLSNKEIRTTHMTGVVTDLAIELGKLAYWNRQAHGLAPVRADRERMAVLAGLLGCFVLGAGTGAVGFKFVGYAFTSPLAVVLAALALVPAVDDWRAHLARH